MFNDDFDDSDEARLAAIARRRAEGWTITTVGELAAAEQRAADAAAMWGDEDHDEAP